MHGLKNGLRHIDVPMKKRLSYRDTHTFRPNDAVTNKEKAKAKNAKYARARLTDERMANVM